MNLIRNFLVFLFFLFCLCLAQGQGLPDLIGEKQKAVLQFESRSVKGEVLGRVTGFLISANGIAILPATLLNGCDSLVAKTYDGKRIGVKKILSVNRQCDLAMVVLSGVGQLEYFTPSRQVIREPEELLILFPGPHASESPAVRVNRIGGCAGVPRVGFVLNGLGSQAEGAPVMDVRGELKGICLGDSGYGYVGILSSSVLSGDNWEDVEQLAKIGSSQGDVPYRRDFLNGMLALHWLDHEKAELFFTMHLRHFPRDGFALYLRSFARMKNRNFTGFESDLMLLKKNVPTSGFYEYLRSLQLIELDRGGEAISLLERSCKLNPEFSLALLALGKLLVDQSKDVNGAFDLFTMALYQDSLLAEGYLERAILLMRFGSDASKGLSDLNRALSLNPRLKGGYVVRGNYYLENQNYGAAIQDLSQALLFYPMDATAFLLRGLAYYNIGLKKESCSDWNQSIRLGNDKASRLYSGYCESGLFE